MLNKLRNSDFLKRGSITIFQRGMGAVLSFVILLFITNLFPESEVGKYQYFNAVLVIVGTLALLGLNVSFIQQIGRLKAAAQEEFVPKLYQYYFGILFISSLIIIGIYFLLEKTLLHQIIPPDEKLIFQQIALILFPYCLTVLNFQVLLGLNKLYLSEFFRNIFKFLVIFLAFLIIYIFNYHHHLIEAFIAANIFIAFISSVYVLISLKKDFALPKTTLKLPFSTKKIIGVSLPMTLSFISLLMMQNMDMLMLKIHEPYETLAYYGIAIKISMILTIIMTAVNQSTGPKIAEYFYKNQYLDLKNIVEKGLLLNNVLSLPVMLLVVIFPKTILGLFGGEYVNAVGALVILTVGQIINAFSGSTDLYLNMTGKQNYFQKIIFLALLLNIVLNYTLIPLYGMEGAAIATSTSLVFWNVLSVIHIKKKDNIWVVLTYGVIKKYLKKK